MPKKKVTTLVQLVDDQVWIYEHWEELCKWYPRKVVGLYQGVIVAFAESFGHLNIEIKAKGLMPAEVAKAYIDPDPDFLKYFLPQRKEKIEALRNGEAAP